MAQRVESLSVVWETLDRSLCREDPLEKEMATHSSILAWGIPRREEPSRLQSMGLQRTGQDWATSLSLSSRRRKERQRDKSLFQKVMAENFPNLGKETSKIQETQRVPKKMNPERSKPSLDPLSLNQGSSLTGYGGSEAVPVWQLLVGSDCWNTSCWKIIVILCDADKARVENPVRSLS